MKTKDTTTGSSCIKSVLIILLLFMGFGAVSAAPDHYDYAQAAIQAEALCLQSEKSLETKQYEEALQSATDCIKQYKSKVHPRWTSGEAQARLLRSIAYALYLQAQTLEQMQDYEKAKRVYNILNNEYRNVFHEGKSFALIVSEELSKPFYADLAGAGAEDLPEFSKAGFFDLPGSGREVASFNVGWRFILGEQENAHRADFDDQNWQLVNLPHGLEYLPKEASGTKNYQGVAWYRKHFSMPADEKGKKHFLHLEAVMGKSEIWLNGELLKRHFGGYLPAVVDLSDHLHFGTKENVIVVKADNSDDGTFPPGKPQKFLDFTYYGGIYRDVWLVSHDMVYITNPHFVDKEAGGGVFVHYEDLSPEQATVVVNVDVANETSRRKPIKIKAFLKNREGEIVGETVMATGLSEKQSKEVTGQFTVIKPNLWVPDSPYLYDLCIQVLDTAGNVLDGVRSRIGLRTIEMRGSEGFFLNGKYYPEKLVGGNRHQDFAHIGNALPNSLHYRDVKKMRNMGFQVVRAAHYPQDPAFMDACDALGIFVITATPGWQFWNDDPIFEERVIDNIRQMIRRDRNRPCILLWETSLNESHYPESFARRSQEVARNEYPYPGAYTSADQSGSRSGFNNEVYDVLYLKMVDTYFPNQKIGFQREWGDNVDNWIAHNSNSRVAVNWGERPMLVQALHYAGSVRVPHEMNLDNLYKAPKAHIGGTLWHTFDHQRGYHADPFYGGVMDAFRLRKTSAYVFESQRSPDLVLPTGKTGPMVYIAHEVTPFSDDDVWVFSNCDEVRLTVGGELAGTQSARNDEPGMPHPPVVFKDAYDWQSIKTGNDLSIKAEGIIGGNVVTTTINRCAQRKTRLVLKIDDEHTPLVADGSDLMTVVAYMYDDQGNIKRLSNDQVRFSVSGAGYLWDEKHLNTVPLEWGRAPTLIRASTTPGDILIKAKVVSNSINGVQDATLKVRTIASPDKLVFKEEPGKIHYQLLGLEPELGLEEELKKVGAQQDEFIQ